MAHTVTYNTDLHAIDMKVYGNLDLSEAKEIISEIIQIGVEKNCFLCLSDYREATVDMSILEIYGVPKIISGMLTQSEISAHKFKRAIVVKKDWKDFHFFETVTLNSGQNAKLFQDIDEAKKWLFEK